MTTPVRALTVRQPWAAAIIHGGKDIENRTYLRSYRGRLLIHAARGEDPDGFLDPRVKDAGIGGVLSPRREIIGHVDLTDAHRAVDGCCAPWGNPGDDVVHFVLRDPVAFARPIPTIGRLGLWNPDQAILDQLPEATTGRSAHMALPPENRRGFGVVHLGNPNPPPTDRIAYWHITQPGYPRPDGGYDWEPEHAYPCRVDLTHDVAARKAALRKRWKEAGTLRKLDVVDLPDGLEINADISGNPALAGMRQRITWRHADWRPDSPEVQ